MDLDEYLWRSKRTATELAKKVNLSFPTMLLIKHKKKAPKLITALKIMVETNGEVGLEDLLSKQDVKDLKKWLEGK